MPSVGGGFSQDVNAAPAKKSGSFMDMFQNPLLQGLGIMGAGNFIGGSPKLPSFNTPEVEAYKNFHAGGISPEAEASINRTVDINQDQQMKNLRDTYKNVRPGTDYTTDSAYQMDLANLQRKQTLDRSDAIANASLGFSQQEMQKASELAQLSIGEIMLRTGMEAEEASQIKQMFGNVGSMFMTKGLFPDAFKEFSVQ